MCLFFVMRDINVQYEHFFIGGNDPFFRILLFIRQDDFDNRSNSFGETCSP